MKTFAPADLINMLRELTLPDRNIVESRELGKQLQVQLCFNPHYWHFVSIGCVVNKMIKSPSGNVVQANYSPKQVTILLVKNNTGRNSQSDVATAKQVIHAMIANEFLNETWAKGVLEQLEVPMSNTLLKCVNLELFLPHVTNFTAACYTEVSEEAQNLGKTLLEKYRHEILNELAKRWLYASAKTVGLNPDMLKGVKYIRNSEGCFVEFPPTPALNGIEKALNDHKASTGSDLQGDDFDSCFNLMVKHFGADISEVLWEVGSHADLTELTLSLVDGDD